MITAVDSSVVLDFLTSDPLFGPASRESIGAAQQNGTIVVSEVVWAEVRAHFSKDGEFLAAMRLMGLSLEPMTAQSATLAGALWREHLRRGGGRVRMVPDFLIGAHALLQADALLSRDRGFYRAYFSKLKLIDPAKTG